jgi:nucleotide-binding universal stress UspA family protein
MSTKTAIVLPTDFSEVSLAALPWAKRMAAMQDAELHCVYAVEEPQIYGSLGMDMATVPMPTAQELADSAQIQLDALAKEHLQGLEPAPVTKVLIGKPADKIIEYADSVSAEMIVMTTHGYSGVKHVLLGSTTEGVLRHANCPVLSIRMP